MTDHNRKDPNTMSVQKIELDELEQQQSGGPSLMSGNYDVIKNVKVRLQVLLGEAELTVNELFALKKDSVVELDRLVSAPVDVILDGKCIARGQLVAAEDNFGIRITEIDN